MHNSSCGQSKVGFILQLRKIRKVSEMHLFRPSLDFVFKIENFQTKSQLRNWSKARCPLSVISFIVASSIETTVWGNGT